MMRVFTLIVAAVFVAIGVMMIRDGDPYAWAVTGFFGFCLLVAIFEPWLPKPHRRCAYQLLITPDEVACEHPKRKRESIRWEDVNRVWYVTTSDGPWLADEWIVFDGESGGCSFPTEVSNMDRVWEELEARFPGFDYGPLIRGGTDDARHLCWERSPTSKA